MGITIRVLLVVIAPEQLPFTLQLYQALYSMENSTQLINFPPFNEAEWFRMNQVPLKDWKKCSGNPIKLLLPPLAHILERLYYAIPRHPAAS